MLGPPLVPIEEERLKTIMRNNERMQELGFKSLATIAASPTVFTPEKTKKEDSASEMILRGNQMAVKKTCQTNH